MAGMKFQHRDLAPEDAEVICSFVQSAEELFFSFPKATYPLTPEVLLAEAGRRQAPTVALADDRVVGYVNLLEARKNMYCTIGNLMVDPRLRRQGVARYLVQTMVAMAVDRHAARFVKTSCFSHNTSAYQLYHALGFRPDGMAPRRAFDGEMVLLVDMVLRRPFLSE